MTFTTDEIEKIISVVKQASDVILNIYNSDFSIVEREDLSPLTAADTASNKILVEQLSEFFPHIPIISEENKSIDYTKRKAFEYCWLIDPLDGTKEFIKRNGEFTINIALVHNQVPIYGLIAQPVTQTIWHNLNGILVKITNGESILLQASTNAVLENEIFVIASRSHLNEATQKLIDKLKITNKNISIVNIGSALKFCLICEHKAHIYPRLAPTMEWDTAAGQSLIQTICGKVIDTSTREPLKYNKENLINSSFIALHPLLNDFAEVLM
jgi:3'(2'), 5'-bisphosphate nucleotidase